MAEDNNSEILPYDDSAENIIDSTDINNNVPIRKNTFKPCFFFGQRIPTIHRPGLYLHMIIVGLQYFFFFNMKEIMHLTLERTFHPLLENQFIYPLISASSYLIIPFIVYFCDLKRFPRFFLILTTLLMAFLAGIFLLIVLLLETFENHKLLDLKMDNDSIVDRVEDWIEYSFSVLSLVIFQISFSLSYPFSVTFGLDLLDGTPLETLLLYFPLFYIAKNIGGSFAYLLYVRWLKKYFYIHCSIANFVLFIALVLSIIGRVLGYFKDSAIADNNFSFYKGLKLLISAFKLRFFDHKKADYNLLMLYAARKKGYHDAKSLVEKTLAMTRINLIFIILTPLLTSYQVLYQLFPEQADPLNFLPLPVTTEKYSEFYCKTESYFLSYWFINPLTVLASVLIIEYFFYDIVFALRSHIPCWIRRFPRKSECIRDKCLLSLRNKLHRHFTLVDPILKRVFWGLPFGLLSAFCAITVEICRAKFPVPLNCTGNYVYYASKVPLIAQVPQYFFSGILETVSIIGLLQYVYFLCSNYFQNSLKGFFFSLFYFYYGVAGVVSNIVNFALTNICASQCINNQQVPTTNVTSLCFIYNSRCKSSLQPNSWAIWVIIIGVYLFMIPLFYIFSHHKHWKRTREESLFEQQNQQEFL